MSSTGFWLNFVMQLSAATATAATRIARQAAFLLSDGSVVGIDGTSNLQFTDTITTIIRRCLAQESFACIVSQSIG